VRGLIGPWGHVYPHQGAPGPAIDFLDLCRRFFAQHLRGEGHGLDDEPALRAWMDGRWIAEPRWPPDREPRRLVLSTERREHRGLLSHGSDGQAWLPWGASSDFAADQRAEDGRSLTFDTDSLERRLEILGEPIVGVELEPAGQVAVRLCDVAPDGSSTLVTFAVGNLRDEGGRVRLSLTAIAYAFPAGHRIRVALAGCYWPWAWPSPRTDLYVREVALELPVRDPRPEDDELPPLARLESPEPPPSRRTVQRDFATRRIESETETSNFGTLRLSGGLEYEERGVDSFSVVEDDPLSAEARSRWEVEIARGDWRTRVVAESSMRADAGAFHLEDVLRAFEKDEQIAERCFSKRVPRDP